MNRRANVLTLALYCLASVNAVVAQTYPAGQPGKFVIPVSVSTDSTTIVNDVVDAPPSGWTSGIRLLLYNRQNMKYIYDAWYHTSADFNNGIDLLLKGENGWPTDALTLISSINGNIGFPLSEIASRLEKLGATNEFEGLTSPAGILAFIGHGGLNMNQAYQSNTLLSGYFAQDVQKNFTFIPLDYLTYALDPTQGTITVGNAFSAGGLSWGKSQTWTASCTNGFFLVRFDRTNPQTANFQKCYPTGSGDQTAFENLLTDLRISASGENNGVFLISVGSPVPPSSYPIPNPFLVTTAPYIRDLGGYAETFANLTSKDTYALVGFPGTPSGIPGSRGRSSEASTLYGGNATGILKGVLQRGRRYTFYHSTLGDLTGTDQSGLYAIIGQPPTPFPHPANAGELTALESISQQICTNLGVSNCTNYNPRNAYPDVNVAVSDLQSALNKVIPPPKVNCPDSTQPFCVVSHQLFIEFQYLGSIRTFNHNLDNFLTNNLTETGLDLDNTYKALESSISPPGTSPAVSIIENVISSALAIIGAIPFASPSSTAGPVADPSKYVGPTFSILGTLFSLGTGIANDSQGNSTTFNYTMPASKLEKQTEVQFNQQVDSLGTLINFICQDWGRMQMLGEALNGAQSGSEWYWDGDTTTAQLLNGAKLGTERSMYESMLAARYAIGYFNAPTIEDYLVIDKNGVFGPCEFGVGHHHPFYLYTPELPDTNVMNTVPMPGVFASQGDRGWLAIADQSDDWWYCNYDSPGPDILEHVFKPPQLDDGGDNGGGLGVYPPEFFNGWAFPRVTCHPSDGSNSGDSNEGLGCPWGSGTGVEGTPPVTRLAATLMSNVRDGPEIRIRLLLLNNGNVGLQNVTIDKIGVRVLVGSGEASLASSTPVSVGNLAAGAGTTIEFDLNVPTTVKKLSLTESGAVQSGAGVSRFSQGQVLFP